MNICKFLLIGFLLPAELVAESPPSSIKEFDFLNDGNTNTSIVWSVHSTGATPAVSTSSRHPATTTTVSSHHKKVQILPATIFWPVLGVALVVFVCSLTGMIVSVYRLKKKRAAEEEEDEVRLNETEDE